MYRPLLNIFVFLSLISLFAGAAGSNTLNKCLWHFGSFEDRVSAVNVIANKTVAGKVQKSVKTRSGNTITFDFIPGSLKKEPLVIAGGLWYKIQYFEMFSRLTTQQSLIQDAFGNAEKILGKSLKQLEAEGHPIIIVSRTTQPESIAASLAEGINQTYLKNKPVTLDEHALDTVDILESLRATKQIGAKKRIQLITLSYGIAPGVHISALANDQISHKHFIAPLARSGDNFPKESAQQEALIQGIKNTYRLMKLNPFTAPMAVAMESAAIDSIYKMAAQKYASSMVDNAMKNDPQLIEIEKNFPGFSSIVKKGLENDMDAARPDRFSLDDPKFIPYFKNSTIYLAGDEDGARLKSQIIAYLKIRTVLGPEAPNLVIMDDAQHAITATAPIQTSFIVTKIAGTEKLQKTNGSIYYMHRADPTARINELNQKAFEIIKAEIDSQSIGPGIPSILEVFFYNSIFKSRVLFTANAIQDLVAATEGPKPIPPDFKENPARPYEKFQYTKLTEDQMKSVVLEIDKQKGTLDMLIAIEKRANEIANAAQGTPQ